MSSAVVPERGREPREPEKKALLNLLGDEDPTVYQAIRAKILTYGHSVMRWLQPATLSSDPVLRRRAIEIIQFLSRQASDNRFLGFCLTQGEELEIEEGSLLLAQTQYPEINTLAYQALFSLTAMRPISKSRLIPRQRPSRSSRSSTIIFSRSWDTTATKKTTTTRRTATSIAWSTGAPETRSAFAAFTFLWRGD
jgi:hypothetical protein